MKERGGNETEENKFRERSWNNLKGRRKCKELGKKEVGRGERETEGQKREQRRNEKLE